MTALAWDTPGERTYQTGVDRGILYLQDGRVAVWNGLTSVEDTTPKNTTPYYMDGFKYLEYVSPEDFSAKLTAFTYPDEFNEVNGVITPFSGFHVYDQPSQSFGLSYRTKIGDDLLGAEAGYLIHIIYNVLANPDSEAYATISDEPNVTEFSWELSARPVISMSTDWRPTAHFSIDSREISEDNLSLLEDTLYGTDDSDPSLPAIDDLIALLAPEILTADFTTE